MIPPQIVKTYVLPYIAFTGTSVAVVEGCGVVGNTVMTYGCIDPISTSYAFIRGFCLGPFLFPYNLTRATLSFLKNEK